MIGRKILLIDNNVEFLKTAGMVFRDAGALVFISTDGMDGIGKMLTHYPDLIILGPLHPGKESIQIYRKIRKFSNIPLILMSAMDQNQLALQGWMSGNADYVTRPVTPQILLLHARAIMNRSEQTTVYETEIGYDDGRLKVDVLRHRVLVRDKRVKLTPVEFRLLIFLVNNADKVLTFEQILINVWGGKQVRINNYVHFYISHLRRKIEDDAKHPRYIRSIHGVGYIFEKQMTRTNFDMDSGAMTTNYVSDLETV
jgi:DNA-binding response OmpR family regulator